MMNTHRPLEPDSELLQQMIQQTADRIILHLQTLSAQPAQDVAGGAALSLALKEGLPETGSELEELLSLLFEKAIPQSYNCASPGYLAYIPGGGIISAALADFIACAVNRYTGLWIAAPGLVQLESNVLRWFCELIGYPEEALGIFTTGGSMANFTAIHTARRKLLPTDFLPGVLYASDQVHHSVQKAAVLAGFPESAVHTVPSDPRFRLRTDLLRSAIAEDRRAGRRPFLIVASAGTTNTGAVDDLDELATLADSEGMWLHIDAAYGGFFILTERGRTAFRGMARSDSITLDPHKGLFLPYGTGCLLVRDRQALRQAHSIRGEYLPPIQENPDFVDFCQYSPELSRDYRGLRVWLPIKLHGMDAFRKNLEEKLDLTAWAADELRRLPSIEIVAEPQLSVVAFRYFRADLSNDQLNDKNREFLARINASRRVMLTATTLAGKFVLRICVLSFRTHQDRLDAALEDIRRALSEIE